MEITKSFFFDAAHRLHKVACDHKCRNVHGHRYEVIVHLRSRTAEALPDKGTMVLDYHKLAPIKEFIDKNLDHAILVANDDTELGYAVEANPHLFGKPCFLSIKETSAELMAKHFAHVFFVRLKNSGIAIKVTIKETPNTSATSDWHWEDL